MTDINLLELLTSLFTDPAAKAAFTQDPQAFLANCGLDHLSTEDVHDAIVLAGDNQSGDFSRHTQTHHAAAHWAPPPPPAHHQPGETDHDTAVRYLNSYVTNNYTDSHDTITDKSVNQQIDNRFGHLDQHFDDHTVTASGPGSVAAGGDIENSKIATGNDDTIGNNDHVLHGSGNTAAFGSGAATTLNDVTLDHSALSTHGNATNTTTENNEHLTNFGSGSVAGQGATANQTTTTTEVNSHNPITTTDTGHNTTTIQENSNNDITTDSHDHVDLASHNVTETNSNNTTHVLSDIHLL